MEEAAGSVCGEGDGRVSFEFLDFPSSPLHEGETECDVADWLLRSYKYELCFFKEAKQKPLKGGSNFSLG